MFKSKLALSYTDCEVKRVWPIIKVLHTSTVFTQNSEMQLVHDQLFWVPHCNNLVTTNSGILGIANSSFHGTVYTVGSNVRYQQQRMCNSMKGDSLSYDC